ncbi:hypothetical protein NC796_25895 [Aliifodinibius sp. S!AR15-10]|uniref:hypothetical protein n=1 Tax=Aliifodinibius sp. S!AR15-10 TaxID=2950437 RepID=UPI002864E93F|nr:hypothetical protein [Aliifodinibius sp. S!AR15-10]MDR8394604.1 hypothetical protein [Aliifodinibius sp. S!AR15-10]
MKLSSRPPAGGLGRGDPHTRGDCRTPFTSHTFAEATVHSVHSVRNDTRVF